MTDYFLHPNWESNTAIKCDSNGLVLDKLFMVSENDIEKRRKQSEAYRKKLERSLTNDTGRGEHHIGCFQENIRAVISNLSLTECGVVITILAKMKLGKEGI